jgi:hypothetical protein
VTGLMQSEVAHASPLLELARLHLDPLLLGMDDLPRPMTDAASAQLGKLNPVTLRGLDRFFHRPSHRTGGYGVGAFAGLGGGWGAFNDVVTVGAAGLGVGITSLLTTFVYGRRVAGYAQNDELRGAALVAANPGLSFQEAERSEAGPLRAAYALPKGDRSTWIRDQLQLRGGTAAHIDFEAGVYCYESRHTDSKGRSSYSTHEVPYLFLPLPADVRGKVVTGFRVSRDRLFGKTDVSLSAAFDRAYEVSIATAGPEASLFVTRVLAPDVQELILRYDAIEPVSLVVTAAGVLARAGSFAAALEEDGYHDSVEGHRFAMGLFRNAHLVHEMFEQLDPSYKAERESKAAVLRQVGLAPSA